MAEQNQPSSKDIDNIKQALVSAGVIKAAALSQDEEAKVNAELARHGVDAAKLSAHLICNRNYCIVVRS